MHFLAKGVPVFCMAAVLLLAVEVTRAGDDDILGGDSIHTDSDVFVRTDLSFTWRVEVSSFVYDSSSVSVPDGTPVPGVGETLFVYLVENTGNDLLTDIAVTDFSIGNPDSLDLLSNASATVVPDGLDGSDRSNPRNFFENSQSVAYNWQDVAFPPPGFTVLNVGEWSVVYFTVEGTYTDQNGTVIAGGISDNHQIPGPVIPEPATMLLTLAGLGLVAAGRSKRR